MLIPAIQLLSVSGLFNPSISVCDSLCTSDQYVQLHESLCQSSFITWTPGTFNSYRGPGFRVLTLDFWLKYLHVLESTVLLGRAGVIGHTSPLPPGTGGRTTCTIHIYIYIYDRDFFPYLNSQRKLSSTFLFRKLSENVFLVMERTCKRLRGMGRWFLMTFLHTYWHCTLLPFLQFVLLVLLYKFCWHSSQLKNPA